MRDNISQRAGYMARFFSRTGTHNPIPTKVLTLIDTLPILFSTTISVVDHFIMCVVKPWSRFLLADCFVGMRRGRAVSHLSWVLCENPNFFRSDFHLKTSSLDTICWLKMRRRETDVMLEALLLCVYNEKCRHLIKTSRLLISPRLDL